PDSFADRCYRLIGVNRLEQSLGTIIVYQGLCGFGKDVDALDNRVSVGIVGTALQLFASLFVYGFEARWEQGFVRVFDEFPVDTLVIEVNIIGLSSCLGFHTPEGSLEGSIEVEF